jgi:hypothetical protein
LLCAPAVETQLSKLPIQLARVWHAKRYTQLFKQLEVHKRLSAPYVIELSVPLFNYFGLQL